jgi:hypothetical protein
MPPTDAEIEQTRKQSLELAAKIEALEREVNDPAKQLKTVFAELDKEAERMGEILKSKSTNKDTPMECLIATVELLGSFADGEVVALEAMGEVPGARKSNAAARPGQRRGVRI